jgi:FeS assembly SUF system protein
MSFHGQPTSPASGISSPAAGGTVAEDVVIEALRTVYDPEIPINIYDLGLIYGLTIGENGDVAITMTLTSPACPVAEAIPQQVAEVVSSVDGVGEVDINLVWDPPWSMDRMSDDARLALDL